MKPEQGDELLIAGLELTSSSAAVLVESTGSFLFYPLEPSSSPLLTTVAESA